MGIYALGDIFSVTINLLGLTCVQAAFGAFLSTAYPASMFLGLVTDQDISKALSITKTNKKPFFIKIRVFVSINNRIISHHGIKVSYSFIGCFLFF